MNEEIAVTATFETNGLPPGQFWNRGAVTLEAKAPDGVTTFTRTLQFLGLEQIRTRIQEAYREYDEFRRRKQRED